MVGGRDYGTAWSRGGKHDIGWEILDGSHGVQGVDNMPAVSRRTGRLVGQTIRGRCSLQAFRVKEYTSKWIGSRRGRFACSWVVHVCHLRVCVACLPCSVMSRTCLAWTQVCRYRPCHPSAGGGTLACIGVCKCIRPVALPLLGPPCWLGVSHRRDVVGLGAGAGPGSGRVSPFGSGFLAGCAVCNLPQTPGQASRTLSAAFRTVPTACDLHDQNQTGRLRPVSRFTVSSPWKQFFAWGYGPSWLLLSSHVGRLPAGRAAHQPASPRHGQPGFFGDDEQMNPLLV